MACGANPMALIIPCHRVVAADGLGGFAGGVAIKKALLALENTGVRL
jgi:methylated-DNA-[protein]-cysteine S-methyltransferase